MVITSRDPTIIFCCNCCGFFPVPYSCWEQLALPFLVILSHLGNENCLTFGSSNGKYQDCMALQGAVVSSCLTHQHHFAGMPLAAWLFLPQSLTMVPTHTHLPPYTYGVTSWKLLSHWSWLEMLHANVLWKMYSPQYKCLPWENIYFAQSETKWKSFLTRKLWFTSHPSVTSGKILSFESYCCLSSGLTDSALIEGTAQLMEPQRWRLCLVHSFCVWHPGCCISMTSGENVNVSTFLKKSTFFLKLTAQQMTFQCIFIFKGCPYTWNNNTGREKTWDQSPVLILTLMNKTTPMCLLL